jgi:hypothetical protein
VVPASKIGAAPFPFTLSAVSTNGTDLRL